MAVYMIQAGGPRGPVKLGHGNPQSRRDDLQVGNHLDLRIIRTFHGGEPEEAYLQGIFADLEIRGEWYSFSRAMLGDIGLVEILPPDPVPEPAGSVHHLIRAEVGLSAYLRQQDISIQMFAKMVNVKVASVHRYVLGERIPRPEILERIIKVTKGAVQANDFFASMMQRQAAHASEAA